MMSKARNGEARAVGAFAFGLNAVETQSQSVNRNDAVRHGSTRLPPGVQAGVVWRRCRQVGAAETVGNRSSTRNASGARSVGPLIVSTSSGLGRRDKEEHRLAEFSGQEPYLGIYGTGWE